MWDRHWCSGAEQRKNALIPKIVPFLAQARTAGIRIIHSPSETMGFYQNAPQRHAILNIPQIDLPAVQPPRSRPLPIEFPTGGCDTGDKLSAPWTREDPRIPIEANDFISTDVQEIYSLLRHENINSVIYVGVHANMCLLTRSFAIPHMSALGFQCILARDLTDAMYSPQDPPFVSHERGTEMMIDYIGQYLCPTFDSRELLTAFSK